MHPTLLCWEMVNTVQVVTIDASDYCWRLITEILFGFAIYAL